MNKTKMISRGETLPNHSTVLEIRSIGGDKSSAAVVLCLWRDEYVTWVIDGATGQAYWGHYFTNLKSALEDFAIR
jgi:hypothetical protein